MIIIGITGPTGSGKTTALQELVALGAHIIDCDAVYHDLLRESIPLREELTARFGDLAAPDGTIDRKRLGAVVFSDPDALTDLNAIAHKYVGQVVDGEIARARQAARPAVGIDAIALLESGEGAKCDTVVGVIAPESVRIDRIMTREGISRDYATLRARAQQDEGFYRARCDHILESGGDMASFRRAARTLFSALLHEVGRDWTG